VVDARHAVGRLGLVVKAAGEAILAGQTLDEVVATAEKATRDTRVSAQWSPLTQPCGGDSCAGWPACWSPSRSKPHRVRLDAACIPEERGWASRALSGPLWIGGEVADGGPVDLAVSHADDRPQPSTYTAPGSALQ
jgi:hypothetical protein